MQSYLAFIFCFRDFATRTISSLLFTVSQPSQANNKTVIRGQALFVRQKNIYKYIYVK